MQIDKSVRAVEHLFKDIDKSVQQFLGNVPVKCPAGCANCCRGQKVAANPLEFLPYSYHLFNTGTLDDRYWDFKTKPQTHCFLVDGGADGTFGKCSEYAHRGVICRLFGNAASVDKNGKKQFSGCSILKSQITNPESFQNILQQSAPVYSDFYMKLRAIDNENGAMLFPINIAILKSMELVYNTTRRKRRRSV